MKVIKSKRQSKNYGKRYLSLPKPNKAQLEHWYLTERLSTRKISEVSGWSQPMVRKFLEDCGIPRRQEKVNPNPKGSHLRSFHRAKIAIALTGNTNWLNPETGKHYTDSRQEIRCDWCGKNLIRNKCRIENVNFSFCDQQCCGKWKSQFLSGKNSSKYSRVEIECLECGKEFFRSLSGLEKRESKRYFCSKDCWYSWSSKNINGDKIYNYLGIESQYRGQNWHHQKKETRIRDNDTCQKCFITKEKLGKNMDVHHKIPFRFFGLKNYEQANSLDNLVSLCPSCHKIVEMEFEKQLRRSI